MASESLLSADRERYWKNRLLKTCYECSTELSSDQFKEVVYRNEVCGHQVCSECLTKRRLPRRCYECIYRGSRTGFKEFIPTTLESDWETFSIELLTASKALKTAAQAELELIVREKDREQAELRLTVEEKDREQAELKTTVGEKDREHSELKLIVREKDREQTELKEENATLRAELETARNVLKAREEKAQEKIDTLCTECGYAVFFEKSRICVSCGIESGYIVEQKTEEGNNVFEVASFDEAEISLLCGSCVLDGAHENHHVVNYFKLKTAQLSTLHNNEINRRLNATFDDGWDTVCQKMRECHKPVIENLTKPDENNDNLDSWEKFQKKQFNQSSIVKRMSESKSEMVGCIHKYTGDMKTLLIEAQTVLQGAKEKIDPREQGVLEVKEGIDPAEQAAADNDTVQQAELEDEEE